MGVKCGVGVEHSEFTAFLTGEGIQPSSSYGYTQLQRRYSNDPVAQAPIIMSEEDVVLIGFTGQFSPFFPRALPQKKCRDDVLKFENKFCSTLLIINGSNIHSMTKMTMYYKSTLPSRRRATRSWIYGLDISGLLTGPKKKSKPKVDFRRTDCLMSVIRD